MSELALFATGGSTLPAHLRGLELDATTKALMGSGDSGKKLSIKGGVFRMVVDGEEVARHEDRAMNIVIIKSAANVSRAYYSSTFVEGESIAPDCTSDDDITPDASATKRQAATCASCPQNIKGSGQNDSRACRYNQKLAVALDNDIGGVVYKLTLPGQSIFGSGEGTKMPLQQYAKLLGGHNIPVTAVVTEMRFDTNSATPKLTFRAQRPLTVQEMEVVKKQSVSADALSAVAPANRPVAATKTAIAAPAQPAPAIAAPEPSVTDVEPKKAKPSKLAPAVVPTASSAEDLLNQWVDDDED
jgi:hypothetical protein